MAGINIIELRTLGELQILVGGSPRRVKVDKHAALLVYLGCHQGLVLRRDVLAELLWEGSNPNNARHSLSQALYQLRMQVPELTFHVSRDEVWLEVGAVQLDVDQFRRAVDEGRLEEAVELYRGDFLRGFWLAGARTFEEWQTSQAQELSRLARFALHSLLREAESGGAWLQVMQLSSRLIELDPYNEQVYRSRIQAIAANEGRQQALAELQRVTEFMEAELGRGLEPATLALKAVLEREPQQPEPPHSEEEKQHYAAFVGRKEEFAWLRSEWEQVKAGVGRCVVVSGEPGIGKTRLCEHVLRLCAIQGARVLQGRSHASDQHLPYSAVIGMLLGNIDARDMTRLPPEWLAILVELLPEFKHLVAGAEQQDPLEGEGGRRRLYEAFVQLFLQLSAGSPLVLHIDDYQWTDESSAALLQYCIRRLSSSQVLILLSMRPEGEERLKPVGAVVSADGSGPGYSRLVLRAMSFDEVEQIVQSYAERQDVDLPESIQNVIFDQVGGRPFFVLEIVKAIASGEIGWGGQERGKSHDFDPVPLPATVEEFLNGSMRGLGEEARSVITALSVLGTCAEPLLVRDVAGIGGRSLVRGVEELSSRGLVHETDKGLAFAHDLIREAAYRSISKIRRMILHEAAGDALRARGGGTNAVLCAHYNSAGRRDLSYRYAILAADDSSRMYGYKEAEYFLKLAIESAVDPDDVITAKEKLGTLLVLTRRFSEAELYLREVVSNPAVTRDVRRLLSVKSSLLLIAFKQAGESPSTLIDEIKVWVERARRLGEHEVHVDLLKLLVQIGHNTGQTQLVLDSVAELSALVDLVNDVTRAVMALTFSANVLSLYQGLTPARPYAEEAVRRASATGDHNALIVALCSRGVNSLQGGRTAEAEEDLKQALSLIERYAAISYQQFALNTYGVLLLEQGRYEEARRVLGEAIGLARAAAAVQDQVVVTGNLLLVEHESGNHERAVALAEEVLSLSGRAPLVWCTIGAWSILGLYALERGDLETARGYHDEIQEHATGRDFWISDASYAEIFLARFGVLEGDTAGALARLDQAIAAYADREFFCRSRLQLERARIMLSTDEVEAGRWAALVRQRASEAGAWPLVVAADRILDSVGLVANR